MTGIGVNPTCRLPEVKAKKPVQDPNSTKYPSRRFYQGHWMTEDQIRQKQKCECVRRRERYHTDPLWAMDKNQERRRNELRAREEKLHASR